MATINLNQADFEEAISKPGITIVDFWADWCGPCKSFAPIFEAASERHPEIAFTKVDTEAEQQLSSKLNISSIPTVMIYRDGILFYNEAGALPSENLDKLLRLVGEIDMKSVHIELADQEKVAIK